MPFVPLATTCAHKPILSSIKPFPVISFLKIDVELAVPLPTRRGLPAFAIIEKPGIIKPSTCYILSIVVHKGPKEDSVNVHIELFPQIGNDPLGGWIKAGSHYDQAVGGIEFNRIATKPKL